MMPGMGQWMASLRGNAGNAPGFPAGSIGSPNQMANFRPQLTNNGSLMRSDTANDRLQANFGTPAAISPTGLSRVGQGPIRSNSAMMPSVPKLTYPVYDANSKSSMANVSRPPGVGSSTPTTTRNKAR